MENNRKVLTVEEARDVACQVLRAYIRSMVDKYKNDWGKISEKQRNDLNRKINLFTEVLRYINGTAPSHGKFANENSIDKTKGE